MYCVSNLKVLISCSTCELNYYGWLAHILLQNIYIEGTKKAMKYNSEWFNNMDRNKSPAPYGR